MSESLDNKIGKEIRRWRTFPRRGGVCRYLYACACRVHYGGYVESR